MRGRETCRPCPRLQGVGRPPAARACPCPELAAAGAFARPPPAYEGEAPGPVRQHEAPVHSPPKGFRRHSRMRGSAARVAPAHACEWVCRVLPPRPWTRGADTISPPVAPPTPPVKQNPPSPTAVRVCWREGGRRDARRTGSLALPATAGQRLAATRCQGAVAVVGTGHAATALRWGRCGRHPMIGAAPAPYTGIGHPAGRSLVLLSKARPMQRSCYARVQWGYETLWYRC
jgi:hypothetical protein